MYVFFPSSVTWRPRQPLFRIQDRQERPPRQRGRRRPAQTQHHLRPAGPDPARSFTSPLPVQPVPQPLQRIGRIARIVPGSIQSDAGTRSPAQSPPRVSVRKHERQWKWGRRHSLERATSATPIFPVRRPRESPVKRIGV